MIKRVHQQGALGRKRVKGEEIRAIPLISC
jgi:hypothetical protein